MRISLVLTALIATPVLLTACAAESAEPVRGTVVDKEYEEAVYGTRKVPVTKKTCAKRWSSVKKQMVETCTSSTVGHKKERYVKKHECYELGIRLNNGDVIERCDKAAYNVLDVEDRYSSDVNYSEVSP